MFEQNDVNKNFLGVKRYTILYLHNKNIHTSVFVLFIYVLLNILQFMISILTNKIFAHRNRSHCFAFKHDFQFN